MSKSWQQKKRLMEKGWVQLLVFAGGIVLYFLLGLFVWWLLKDYVVPSDIDDPSTRATAKKDLVQALGLIMAGVAGVIGIFFTWRGQRLIQLKQKRSQKNTEASQKSTEAQLEIAHNTLDITRRGQITERFTRAIDQLGATHDDKSKNLELRLGGIYALERIARESEEDHWPSMEVLTAYVRQHARPLLGGLLSARLPPSR